MGKAHKKARLWIELVTPDEAKVMACCDHPAWGKYAAVTGNNHGKGTAIMPEYLLLEAILDKK